MHAFSLTNRSDAAVLEGVKKLAGRERETTAWLVAHLAEIDARQLFRGEGCSCLLKYCTEVLRLSEPAANRRIYAARLARRFPIVFRMLHEGSIHLTTASILGPCLTSENFEKLLTAARHKTKEELLLLAASINPKPDVPTTIRKLLERGVETTASRAALDLLPIEGPSSAAPAPASPVSSEKGVANSESAAEEALTVEPRRPAPVQKAIVAPLSAERYRVQFTASAETTRKLRQLQELLRHQIPNGDPAVIFEWAIDLLHEQVMGQKVAQVKRPRKSVRVEGGDTGRQEAGAGVSGQEPRTGASRREPAVLSRRGPGIGRSRHIPSEVKRTVWSRDGGQCAFVSRNGRRCSERGRLEFHHCEPHGWGGAATIENIALRCRAHNAYEGERAFGETAMARRLNRDRGGNGSRTGGSASAG